jgi:hypothetical protein
LVELKGSTPAARLKAIANASMELNIPKTTFNKFFSDEKILPDAVAKLMGRVDDPKQIIMDTIVEMAHTVSSAKAYKEIAEFGMDKFIFRNRKRVFRFCKKKWVFNLQEI